MGSMAALLVCRREEVNGSLDLWIFGQVGGWVCRGDGRCLSSVSQRIDGDEGEDKGEGGELIKLCRSASKLPDSQRLTAGLAARLLQWWGAKLIDMELPVQDLRLLWRTDLGYKPRPGPLLIRLMRWARLGSFRLTRRADDIALISGDSIKQVRTYPNSKMNEKSSTRSVLRSECFDM